jgi:hypothetical protein
LESFADVVQSTAAGTITISATGLASPGEPTYAISGLAIEPFVAVPEPSTLALFALGTAALAGWRRWRKGAVV